MRIVEVTFGSNLQVKPFHHVRVEVTADVPLLEGEGDEDNHRRARQTLDELKLFVASELKRAKEGERRPTGSFTEMMEEDFR